MRREIKGRGNILVGRMIKQLRKQRGLTGTHLGRKASMSQSKISKIETGYYTELEIREVDQILNILEAPNDIRQKIYRELEQTQVATLVYKPYYTAISPDLYEVESKSAFIRIFTLQQVPALLQTTARRIEALKRFGVAEADMAVYLRDTARRQDLLWDKDHSFHLILHGLMLYAQLGGSDILGPQLDRIERLMDLPNVKIGMIPLEAGLPLAEIGPFALHDAKRLYMGSAGGDIVSTNADSIALYSRVFAELDQLALYGEPAKKMMHNVFKR